jgi:shikimate kinase
VVLVGAPGAGKTTVGSLVAEHLGVAFRDTDRDVEGQSGKTVADVFLEDGEPAFRAMEQRAVLAALADHDGVLALGGGAVMAARVRAALRGSAVPVVHLAVGARDAAQRVGLAQSRPVLAMNPRATLIRMLDERAPLYAEVATAVVPTDGRAVEDVATDVLGVIRGG